MLTKAKKRTMVGGLMAGVALLGAAVAGGFSSRPSAEPVSVGDSAPSFTLTDTNGESHTLADYRGKTVVLEWFNPDCPFVKKFHTDSSVMRDTHAKFAGDSEIVFMAINSGAPGKQGAGLERNRKAVEEYQIGYPVLLDESGEVGKAFGAKRTPEIFVIDAEGVVRYHGPIDDNSSYREVGQNYLELAVTQVKNGETDVVRPQIGVYGCSVKYAK
ncbi:MAG: redoxin domain-containing protein [Planctomycetota bacterium]